jgi:small subunit ribosomal protein S2
VDFKLPGNDDAIRSIRLFCQIIADSVMEAKYGYLPPDSVFIRAAETEEGEGADLVAAAVGAAPAASTTPPAPALAEQPVAAASNGTAEQPVAAAPELGGALNENLQQSQGESLKAEGSQQETEIQN